MNNFLKNFQTKIRYLGIKWPQAVIALALVVTGGMFTHCEKEKLNSEDEKNNTNAKSFKRKRASSGVFNPDCFPIGDKDFKSFNVLGNCSQSLIHSSVYVLAEVNGALWAGTFKGLSISSDFKTFKTLTTTDGLDNNYVYSINVISDDKIFLGHTDGVSYTIDGGESFSTFKVTKDAVTSSLVLSVKFKDQKYFILTDKGLFITADLGQSFTLKTMPSSGTLTYYDMEIWSGKIIIGTSAGVYISSDMGMNFTLKNSGNGLGGNIVKDISISYNVINLATNKGLSVTSDGFNTFSNFSHNNLLSNLPITYEMGAKRYFKKNSFIAIIRDLGISFSNNNGASYTFYDLHNGLPHNEFIGNPALIGSKFFVPSSYGIIVFNINTFEVIDHIVPNPKEVLAFRNILDLLFYQNKLFVLTNNGLLVSSGEKIFDFELKIKAFNVNKLTYYEDHIYVSSGKDIYVSNNGGNSFTKLNFILETNGQGVMNIFANSSGLYILATNSFYHLEHNDTHFNEVFKYDASNGLNTSFHRSLYVDGDLILIGSSIGLFISNDGGSTFTLKTKENNGLSDNKIYSITKFNNSYLLGTNIGVTVLNEDFAVSTLIDSSHGLPSNYVERITVDEDQIFLYTNMGLVELDANFNVVKTYTMNDGLNSNSPKKIIQVFNNLLIGTSQGLNFFIQ